MRLEISRKTDLAVRALCELSGKGHRIKGSDLATQVDSSQGFMAHVMTPLVHAGWVSSEPGPLGGYRLVVPLEQISLLQVIEEVEGATVDGRCVLRAGPCPSAEICALHNAWLPARDALLQRLAETSVEEATGCAAASSASL